MKTILSFLLGFCAISGTAFSTTPEEAGAMYFEGRQIDAAKAFKKLSKKDDTPSAFLNAAFIFGEQGYPKKQKSVLEDGLDKFPADVSIKHALAETYLALGNFKKAEQLYSELLKTAGDDHYRVGLGQALIGLGEYVQATNTLADVKDYKQVALAYYFLGKAYEGLDQTDAAISAYEKVLSADSQFIEVRPMLAELYARQKRYDDSWRQYKKLSYADPKNQTFRDAHEKLLPLLTRKPDEIIPPAVIASHTKVRPVVLERPVPMLRVGIGTNAAGVPLDKKDLAFSCSVPFTVKSSGTVIASGNTDGNWAVRMDQDDHSKGLLVDPSGKIVAEWRNSIMISQKNSGTGTFIIKALVQGDGTAWGGIADKEVRGSVEIINNRKLDTLVIVNHVNMEEYLYGVLAAEMPWRFPQEALRAQAVMARTYISHHIGKHAEYGYDICDGQHCQVYEGVKSETMPTSAAADATQGLMLMYENKPVEAVFSSNSGGFTQSGKEAGWTERPYWQVKSDYVAVSTTPLLPETFRQLMYYPPKAYSEPSIYVNGPTFRWSRVVTAGEIASKVASKQDIGRVLSVIPDKRGSSGRVMSVTIKGTRGTVTFDREFEIRKYLATGLLRSTMFVMDTFYGKDGKPAYFVFHGGGWGHGVGFCQCGSSGRAAAGMSYKEILENYYPGTELKGMAK